jgi:hypothetical protein
MSYYKDGSNRLHYLSEEDIENGGLDFLPNGSAPISDTEAAQIIAANAPAAPTLTKIYKHDIWDRATESEAEILDALLDSQSAKLRRMWTDSLSINTNDELYPMVYAACVAALDPGRADIILEPTE